MRTQLKWLVCRLGELEKVVISRPSAETTEGAEGGWSR